MSFSKVTGIIATVILVISVLIKVAFAGYTMYSASQPYKPAKEIAKTKEVDDFSIEQNIVLVLNKKFRIIALNYNSEFFIFDFYFNLIMGTTIFAIESPFCCGVVLNGNMRCLAGNDIFAILSGLKG